MMMRGFLLGIIVACSFAAGAYFLRFWRKTADPLFLGFGAAFLIEGANRIVFLFFEAPEAGNPVVYSVRLLSYLIILFAIANKNRRGG
jgi:uncharacterized membrane protein HdeD (DUF308 family)